MGYYDLLEAHGPESVWFDYGIEPAELDAKKLESYEPYGKHRNII